MGIKLQEKKRRLLLLLYPLEGRGLPSLNYDQLACLQPGLSQSGLRSQVAELKAEGLIAVSRLGKKSLVRLTEAGKRVVEEQFPVFSPEMKAWEGEIQLLIFLEAPKTDASFRYLRSRLVEQGAVALTRGVYAHPGAFPGEILSLCESNYALSVVVLAVKRVVLGQLGEELIAASGVSELSSSYSGISKDLTSLLKNSSSYQHSSDEVKQSFLSLFDRYFGLVSGDLGLGWYYFPQEVAATDCLAQFQSFLLRKY